MISILNSYNNDGYVESRPRLFRLLNLLISKNFKSHASSIFEQAQAKVADKLRQIITRTTFRLMFSMLFTVSETQLPTGTALPCSVLILSMAKNQSDVENLAKNCLNFDKI